MNNDFVNGDFAVRLGPSMTTTTTSLSLGGPLRGPIRGRWIPIIHASVVQIVSVLRRSSKFVSAQRPWFLLLLFLFGNHNDTLYSLGPTRYNGVVPTIVIHLYSRCHGSHRRRRRHNDLSRSLSLSLSPLSLSMRVSKSISVSSSTSSITAIVSVLTLPTL